MVSLAKTVVSYGADFLHFVHGVVDVGSTIKQDVAGWLGDNLFKLELLELNGRFDRDSNACVGLKVNCVIIGLPIKVNGTSLIADCNLYPTFLSCVHLS